VDTITSRTNPKIKQARALRQRKERDESGLFLVEGITHVAAAVEAGATVEYICYAPDLLASAFANDLITNASARNIPCYPTSAKVFEAVSEKENPTGLIAVARKPTLNLNSLISNLQSWYVALVSPQDPGNIGAILRTIDAVGASGLLLLDGGADPFHPNAVRASMGAIFRVPVVPAIFGEFRAWAKEGGFNITGTSARARADYRTAEYKRPLILLLGSEQKGLSPEQAAACSQMIRLPMQGKVSSLNLAVAAGVMLYEILAQSR
jgi:TrmH family RNA methyltransferase